MQSCGARADDATADDAGAAGSADEEVGLDELAADGALGSLLDRVGAGRSAVVRAPSGALVRLVAAGRPDGAVLSPREVEVLALVAQGLPGSRVAAQLGLAPNTVAQHLVSVRRKFGVRTSADAVDLARRSGQLPA